MTLAPATAGLGAPRIASNRSAPLVMVALTLWVLFVALVSSLELSISAEKPLTTVPATTARKRRGTLCVAALAILPKLQLTWLGPVGGLLSWTQPAGPETKATPSGRSISNVELLAIPGPLLISSVLSVNVLPAGISSGLVSKLWI